MELWYATLFIGIILALAWVGLGDWQPCPREEMGYRCHSYLPGGCEACGAGTKKSFWSKLR